MIRNRLHLVSLLSLVVACSATSSDPDPTPDPDPDPDPDPAPTEMGGWTGARMLHDLPGSSYAPALRVDASGRATAVWEQHHPTTPYQRMWASRQTESGWEPPTLIATDSNTQGEIAVTGDGGTATTAWRQSYLGELRIVASRVDATGAWGQPTVLRASSWEQGPLVDPRLAASSTHVALVWAVQDPVSRRYALETATRKTGAEWNPPSPIATGVALAMYGRALYDVTVDDETIVVAWGEQEPDRVEIWVRRGVFVDGSLSVAWEPARKLTMLPTTTAYPLRELWTGTHAGRGFVGWLAAEADDDLTVAVSHVRADGSWDAEQPTRGIASSHYAPPRFVAGADGHKVVLWREPLADASRIVARTYDPDRGWEEERVVADGLKPPYLGCIDIDAYYFDVAIDSSGNALAIWEERLDEMIGWHSGMGLWSSQYIVGRGWQAPLRVDAGGVNAMIPQVVLADGTIGAALFTVEAEDGSRGLATNQFAPIDPQP